MYTDIREDRRADTLAVLAVLAVVAVQAVKHMISDFSDLLGGWLF